MTFLRSQWYFYGWSDELADGGKLARTILGEPILTWRGSGRLFAVEDRCPHRLVPLSMGRVADDTVSCGYHGLKFDGGSGRCIDNPHGAITSALAIRHYPITERHNAAWIWMGDPELADPDDITNLDFIDNAKPTAFNKGYLHTAAGHSLLEDNILDLSHTDYLHPETLGGGSLTRCKARVEERGDAVFVQWLVNDEPAIPVFQPEMPEPSMNTDMWTEVLWQPNGVMILRTGAAPAGMGQEAGVDSWNAHVMTPETETTTHYFFCNTRSYRTDDADYNAALEGVLRFAFANEDKPMVEAQQRATGPTDLLELKPALLGIDNASTRARRIYRRMVERQMLEGQSAIA